MIWDTQAQDWVVVGGPTTGITLGTNSSTTTANDAIRIGQNAGETNQGKRCVAIGTNAGQNNQGSTSVAIGFNAGDVALAENAVVIGAGASVQGEGAVAIGIKAEGLALAENAVIIGAGASVQGEGAVAVGASSLCNNSESICLGKGCEDSNGKGFNVSIVRLLTTPLPSNIITKLGLLPTPTGFELVHW